MSAGHPRALLVAPADVLGGGGAVPQCLGAVPLSKEDVEGGEVVIGADALACGGPIGGG